MLTVMTTVEAQESFAGMVKGVMIIAVACAAALLLWWGYALLFHKSDAWEVENRADPTYEIDLKLKEGALVSAYTRRVKEAPVSVFDAPVSEVFADVIGLPPKAFDPRQTRTDRMGKPLVGFRVIGYMGFWRDCPTADIVVWVSPEVVASLEVTIAEYATRYGLTPAIEAEVKRQNAVGEFVALARQLRINGVVTT